MFCLDPPLTKVPKGTWFCENCAHLQEDREATVDESYTPPKIKPKKKESQPVVMLREDGLSDVDKIKNALLALGGKATGAAISNRIAETYEVPLEFRKTLAYRVNALLSAKSNTFRKQAVMVEGSHRASVWTLEETNDTEAQETMEEEKMEAPRVQEPLSEQEVLNLIEGVRKYGTSRWSKIVKSFEFHPGRGAMDLKMKWLELTDDLPPQPAQEQQPETSLGAEVTPGQQQTYNFTVRTSHTVFTYRSTKTNGPRQFLFVER